MSSVKGLHSDRLKVKLHKSKKSKSKKHERTLITLEEAIDKWEDLRDRGGWTNEELAHHLLDVHKVHCDMQTCMSRLHALEQPLFVSSLTQSSLMKGQATIDDSNKTSGERESAVKCDEPIARRRAPSQRIAARDKNQVTVETVPESSLPRRKTMVSTRKRKRSQKKSAGTDRKKTKVPDETPAVTLMYELADEMTAGGTIQDISPGQEARLKEEFDLVSDTNTDSLQEERDTNDSTPPKVKKPRNPPKWAISWREMEITFSCKVCEFQTTSPVFACDHLLLAHPDIVEPLQEYLDKETVPGSEESLLKFVVETSKSKENGKLAAAAAEEDKSVLDKTKTGVEDFDETFVVPVYNDPVTDSEQVYKHEGSDEPALGETATINQGKSNNTEEEIATANQGDGQVVMDTGVTNQTGKDKEMNSLGETPKSRLEGLQNDEVSRGQMKEKNSLKGLTKNGTNLSKNEPFSEFSLIEMEEFITYIRRWMHVDKHCNKCHSKIKGQRLTNLHHCAANTGVTLCEICGKYYRNNGYGNHVRQVHNKGKARARCKHCNKEMTASALFKHFRYVHERELHKVACGMCGKMMSTKEHLRRHEIIHRVELPFKCPFCQRGFSQKSNMHHHIRQHTGEQPYSCDHCLRAFTHKVSLKNHLKKQHGIDLWKQGQTGGGRPKPKDADEEKNMDVGN
ncbi:uncharacterized protein [Apostichopus japonicus]|uniref:uncharacterized protein n=1 Tax=Stichopus japonicus TaxID=307972 RepID=UPI003AB69785